MNSVLPRRMGTRLERLRSFLGRAFAGLKERFGGTEPALCHTSAAVAAAVMGAEIASSYWPRTAGYILCSCAALVLVELALWLAQALLRRWLGHGLGWLMSLALLVGAVAYAVRKGAGEGWTWRVWLFSALAAGILWLLAASWWSLIVRHKYLTAVAAVAAASTALAVVLGAFYFGDGFRDRYIGRLLALSHPDAAQEALEPSLGPGPHPVELLDYGPDTDLDAGSVNLTAYMSRDTGDLTGDYVDAYWDYDLNAVPLAGRVWYPADGENCPVLFIAHGNHEILTPSYQGYGYLGEYLASHGYAVVSVDANACNMLSGENDGRAVLLLKHIGKILEFNGEQGNPLYSKLDVDNLAIAGHSRGGEAVATAYLFNGYDQYPENGTVHFDFHYPIRSLIAIAPTVDQYQPADHSVEIEDVNYLLLHGAADRDVTNFMGMRQYENLTFTGQGDYLKTTLYIAAANHGQFNTLWGENDQHGAQTPLLNRASLLSEQDQQRIAQIFIKVFLDVTLKGDTSCVTLLTDWDSYAGQIPRTVYYQCWESSRFEPIADFEEDSDLETATMEGASLMADGVNWWTEEQMSLAGSGGDNTHALRLRWTGRGSYTATVPPLDVSGRYISFDLCDLDSKAIEKEDYSLVEGTVRITDSGGSAAEASISDYATVFPILPVQTDKLDFLFHTCVYKQGMATVAIPAEVFTPAGVDLGSIVEIQFEFPGGGEIAIDNIGIEG